MKLSPFQNINIQPIRLLGPLRDGVFCPSSIISFSDLSVSALLRRFPSCCSCSSASIAWFSSCFVDTCMTRPDLDGLTNLLAWGDRIGREVGEIFGSIGTGIDGIS